MKQLRQFWVSLALLFSIDASAITIDLIADNNSIANGGTVAVHAKITGLNSNDAPSLGVYDLDFNFDSSLFNFKNVIRGDSDKGNQLDLNGFGSLQSSNIGAGIINLFELSFDDAATLNNWQAGEFTLFTLLFDAIAIGTGHFSLDIIELGDADANSLTAGSGSTSVAVGTTHIPEPSSWMLLLGAFAIVLLRMRNTSLTK